MEEKEKRKEEKVISEADPKKGTGKKPKGSARRLYTDENPDDTVPVKFRTVQDIKDTLSRSDFKSKSHARQSQIINLIHQRVRAAYQNAKDPDTKKRLKKAFDYAKKRKEASKKKTEKMRKESMNISKEKLKQIIKEEIELALANEELIYETDVLPHLHEAFLDDGTPVCVACLHEQLEEAACDCPDLVYEAEYRGRKVKLNKPMRGDVKKFKVYVKDPKTGNIRKVNFGHGGTSAKRKGEKTMRIRKSNPKARKNFRARHNCKNPGPKTKARYWSCKAW